MPTRKPARRRETSRKSTQRRPASKNPRRFLKNPILKREVVEHFERKISNFASSSKHHTKMVGFHERQLVELRQSGRKDPKKAAFLKETMNLHKYLAQLDASLGKALQRRYTEEMPK